MVGIHDVASSHVVFFGFVLSVNPLQLSHRLFVHAHFVNREI